MPEVQIYELILIEKGNSRVISRPPLAERPYGSFNRGEIVRINGTLHPIEQVIHQFIDRDSIIISSTMVLLGAALPETALGNITVPEPAKLPKATTPIADQERRPWWRR